MIKSNKAKGGFEMALKDLAAWSSSKKAQAITSACGSACGAKSKSACGSACGAGDKKAVACGTGCGASDK